MTPLRIRARLVNGYVTKDVWSPALDGIVAAIVMRERLGEEFFTAREIDMRLVEGLPLDVVRHGDRWWYAVSSPEPLNLAGRDRRYFHRRFDDQHEDYLGEKVTRVMTSAGPYKSSRLWEQRSVCKGIEWHAIGEATDLRRLLARVDQIGGGRARGFGEVAEWIVEDCGDAETARHHRPLPVEYARERGIEGRIMPWGIVPPARIAAAICECVMP